MPTIARLYSQLIFSTVSHILSFYSDFLHRYRFFRSHDADADADADDSGVVFDRKNDFLVSINRFAFDRACAKSVRTKTNPFLPAAAADNDVA